MNEQRPEPNSFEDIEIIGIDQKNSNTDWSEPNYVTGIALSLSRHPEDRWKNIYQHALSLVSGFQFAQNSFVDGNNIVVEIQIAKVNLDVALDEIRQFVSQTNSALRNQLKTDYYDQKKKQKNIDEFLGSLALPISLNDQQHLSEAEQKENQLMSTFNIFSKHPLSSNFESVLNGVRSRISNETPDYLLNVNEQEYQNYQVQEATIKGLFIDFDGKRIEEDWRSTSYDTWNKYPVLILHLPFEGNGYLFEFNPFNNNNVWTKPAYFCNKDSKCICFDIVPQMLNSETINQDIEIYIKNLRRLLDGINGGVQNHNASLPQFTKEVFSYFKENILRTRQILAEVGIPLRREGNLPQTYAIPTPELKKSISIKPDVKEKGYTPEPTLDLISYREILQILHDIGKVFERLPSILKGKEGDKGEEAIRDLIILYLTPRFGLEGSVTGETFNAAGKVDILLRYQNSNAFVAECKFWTGPKGYLAAITQVLSYLTWRDSKASIIIFNRGTQISTVLEGIETFTKEHENYLGFVNQEDKSWFNFRFHINGDDNREVKLAVLVFNLIT